MLQTILKDLAVPVVIAVVTALVTVRLSLRQFRSERWWEKKEDSYSRIISALFYVHHHNEAIIQDANDQGTGNSLEVERRAPRSAEAGDTIDEATAVASFRISTEAAKVLQNLKQERARIWKQLRHDASWPEYIGCLEDENRALAATLSAFRDHVRKDLDVK